MKNIRFRITVFVVILWVAFLFTGCSALQRGKIAEEEGKYEDAIKHYVDDLNKHPDRSESKERIRTLAAIVVPQKIEDGDENFARNRFRYAWDAYQGAYWILTELKHFGLSIESEQHYLNQYEVFKKKIVSAAYARGNRLMNDHEYRAAYADFEIINEVLPDGYRDVDRLMNECIRLGQVRIAVVIMPQRNSWIIEHIYPEIKAKILKKSSPFLKLIEADIPHWDRMTERSAIARNLGERRLDKLVVLSVEEYRIIPNNERKSITLYYVTKKDSSSPYRAIPVGAYECINRKTLRLGINYEFIDAKSGDITHIQTIQGSDQDKVEFTKLADRDDESKDKRSFALNCPKPDDHGYSPKWYPAEKFEEKYLRSNEIMLERALRNIPDIIMNEVLYAFDR
ncbi:MAG: hypothetical protein ACM3SY_05615 [Candidatus Omnitrophota bacterium]